MTSGAGRPPFGVIARGFGEVAAGQAGSRGLATTPLSLGLSRMTDHVTAPQKSGPEAF
jgi:hypothetical protein